MISTIVSSVGESRIEKGSKLLLVVSQDKIDGLFWRLLNMPIVKNTRQSYGYVCVASHPRCGSEMHFFILVMPKIHPNLHTSFQH